MLLSELEQVSIQLVDMIQRINKTNHQTIMLDGQTLADGLVVRDVLIQKRKIINHLIESAAPITERYSHSEIRKIATLNIADLQKQLDGLAKQIREIDTKIQELNWLTELI